MRIFKRRVLVIGFDDCIGGINTFLKGWIPLLDKIDVAIDHISFRDTPDCLNEFKKHGNYNTISNSVIKTELGEDGLRNIYNKFSQQMFFYGSFVNNPVIDAKVIDKVHYALSKNYYDFILLNHPDTFKPILSILNLEEIMDVIVYTHSGDIFNPNETKDYYFKKYRDCIFNSIKSATIISQRKNSYLDELKLNYKVISMPLSLKIDEKLPEKEDAVLYLGRVVAAKNIEGWVKIVSKQKYKAYVIVPSEKEKNKFVELFKKYKNDNFHIFYDISQDKKWEIIKKVKCFFVSSDFEAFPFVILENYGYNNVIVLDRTWSRDFNNELPIKIVSENEAPKEIEMAIENYDDKKVKKNAELLYNYIEEIDKKWEDYLLKDKVELKEKKNKIKAIQYLEKYNDYEEALHKMGRLLDFSEFSSLYKNIDTSKIIQTKEKTYYEKVKEKLF